MDESMDAKNVDIDDKQTSVNELICDIMRTKKDNIPSTKEYTENGARMDTMDGISITGVPLYNGLSAEIVDPFYPKAWSGSSSDSPKQEDVDLCGAHPANRGDHHYHMSPLCPFNTELAKGPTTMCSDNAECSNDALTYYTDNIQNKNKAIIGISKDGHRMYGPYAQADTLWDKTNIDYCNGMMVDGRYSYVSTTFHPYMLGCFGPANVPSADSLDHECSYNTRNANCVPLFSDTAYFNIGGSNQGGPPSGSEGGMGGGMGTRPEGSGPPPDGSGPPDGMGPPPNGGRRLQWKTCEADE